jgi:hypothetical protein
LQWSQNPSQTNGDNLGNVRREISRNFRNRKRGYLEEQIHEHETSSENKISETYIEVYMNLRRTANLEIAYYKMKMVICLHIPTVF